VRLAIVGRVVEQKRHMVELEACARLKRRGIARQLDIVGTQGGGFCNAVEARIAALGLAEQVRWRGFVADRDRLYGDLDILVAPAVDEPFGLTVAEAGAFPEVVEDGRTGLLFTPGDAADLVRNLERLVLDSSLRRRLGAAGRERMASTFTIDTMAQRFLEACATSS
jgi:glycosyltransferase involved in cell wall biosynthesis